jgi:hypothetical protein
MSLWPQYTFLALSLFGLGVNVSRYGQQKKDKYDLSDCLIAPIFGYTILYYGGFFAPLGWHP